MTRILIADDNPQNRYLLETLIQGCGYKVISAGNGAAALDLARKNPPNLVISDILMPKMDGFELCRSCKAEEQLRDIPFIFYTAHYTDPKDEKFALSLGADRLITKPEQPEVLAQIIQQVVENRARKTIASPVKTLGEDKAVSQQYSEVLFRQLEKKMKALEQEIAERKNLETKLENRLLEIESLKQQLEKENISLRREIKLHYVHKDIVYRSSTMKKILAQIEQVARTDATVLIEGETGTGKELLARAVHRLSDRKDRPLVMVNCASLPITLVESELFGREKGAYTGALTRMIGRFELADGATLFLDEVGELPLEVQAKLLRVLEQGSFERLGSTKSMQVDVRIIAATNQSLSRQIETGKFRKDLYYRLNVFPIHAPPLRERSEDIPPLIWTFVRQYEGKMGKRISKIPSKSMDKLQHYAWPGNVRELRNMIERAMIVSTGKTLNVNPPRGTDALPPEHQNLEEVERSHIVSVLQQTGWRLSGSGGADGILGLKRTTLQSKMKKLGIQRPKE